jgi:hypothetical protein
MICISSSTRSFGTGKIPIVLKATKGTVFCSYWSDL